MIQLSVMVFAFILLSYYTMCNKINFLVAYNFGLYKVCFYVECTLSVCFVLVSDSQSRGREVPTPQKPSYVAIIWLLNLRSHLNPRNAL